MGGLKMSGFRPSVIGLAAAIGLVLAASPRAARAPKRPIDLDDLAKL
jgi:hypothetical protein